MATAPNYTDQPEIALEHVFQVMTDRRFIPPSVQVQVYYTLHTHFGSLEPCSRSLRSRTSLSMRLRNSRTTWILTSLHSSSRLTPSIVRPLTVMGLNSTLQLVALHNMLSAAQKAEDNRKVISQAAIAAVNAQSFLGIGGPSVNVNASQQSERKLDVYKKKDLACFGCGLNHPWSQRQADGSFVEVCPNKDKAGVCAAANVKIADIHTKQNARKDK